MITTRSVSMGKSLGQSTFMDRHFSSVIMGSAEFSAMLLQQVISGWREVAVFCLLFLILFCHFYYLLLKNIYDC